jgi:hypothetical protein
VLAPADLGPTAPKAKVIRPSSAKIQGLPVNHFPGVAAAFPDKIDHLATPDS